MSAASLSRYIKLNFRVRYAAAADAVFNFLRLAVKRVTYLALRIDSSQFFAGHHLSAICAAIFRTILIFTPSDHRDRSIGSIQHLLCIHKVCKLQSGLQ
jgi:hypothetical protein